MSSPIVKILGIDPGLRKTGWGVIEVQGNVMRPLGFGVVSSNSDDDLGKRLNALFIGLCDVIETFHPDEAAVEETFVNMNPGSTLKLGMARGVAMLAPAFKNLLVAEYAANKIKKSVVGVGHASKDQVIMMVSRILPSLGAVTSDAADALAVAITHSHYRSFNILKAIS
jgi:crossover junction endodeoxyribonuclease RuvC